jgi:hypothetical protein
VDEGGWAVRSRKEMLTDIPDDLLDKIIAGFALEGAKVEKQRQPEGKWTVVAFFAPDDQRRPLTKGAYRS